MTPEEDRQISHLRRVLADLVRGRTDDQLITIRAYSILEAERYLALLQAEAKLAAKGKEPVP